MSDKTGLNEVDTLVRRCATCCHWQGDKEKATALFEENPLSMDLFKGWPNDGDCLIDYEFLNVEIHGNATVSNTLDANFGCVYWGRTMSEFEQRLESKKAASDSLELLNLEASERRHLVLTDTPPTEPGWYWFKTRAMRKLEVVKVFKWKNKLGVSGHSCFGTYVGYIDAMWAGPIPEPEA